MPRCLQEIPQAPNGEPETWVSRIRVNRGNSPINSGRLRWTLDSQRVPVEELYEIIYREMPSPESDSNEMPNQTFTRRRQSRQVGIIPELQAEAMDKALRPHTVC